MFKNPFQVAITFAIAALIIKLTFFALEIQHGIVEEYIRYIYLFLVLVAVFFGIRSEKIAGGPSSFGKDFKSGARTASFFAILVAVITYIYYTQIDTHFFDIKKTEIVAEYAKSVPSLIENEGRDEARKKLKNAIKGMNTIYSPYSQATYTLFALVFMGMFDAVIFALLMKKMNKFNIVK